MIFDAITNCEGDIMALTEINKYWLKVEEQDKWKERIPKIGGLPTLK